MNKFIKVFSVAVVLISLSLQAKAQFMPTTTRINTPYGGVNVQTFHYMPNMYNYGYNMNYVNTKFNLNVVMNNGDTLYLRTRINQDTIHYLIQKVKREKTEIRPEETKGIYLYNLSKKVEGFPTDSCWLFLTKPGKINVYSDRPVLGTYCATAIQLDDGPIVALTKQNLEGLLPEEVDEKILKQLDKQKLIKVINMFNKANSD